MPFSLFLVVLTVLSTNASPAVPRPGTPKPQRVRLEEGMPIYLRAFAAEQTRRLAEKRTRASARQAECAGGAGAVVSRPWNRNRKAVQSGLITGQLNSPSGAGIEGARIAIHPLSLVTRSERDGSFRLAIPPQLLGTVDRLTVSVQAIGYGPHREDVTLEPGDAAHISARLCRQTIQVTQIAAGPAITRSRSGWRS